MVVLRIAVPVLALLFGLLGVLTGSVIAWSALREGAITTVHVGAERQAVWTTTARAREPSAYWWQFCLLGLAPVLVGSAAVVGSWRALKS